MLLKQRIFMPVAPVDVDRAFDLGANAFLVKPSSIEALTAIGRSLRDWIGCTHFPQLNELVRR